MMLRFRELLNAAAVASWLGGASATAQPSDSRAKVRMVDVDGRAVRVQAIGLDRRRPGSPTVVFEAGAATGLDVWSSVLPNVASAAPVVAYDRAGLGLSEWDNEPPTPRHVSNRLRRLLERLGAKPPYVLVGYSWGGNLARYFAGYHPDEVAGLVFVDPGPIVTQSLAERLAPFDAIGAGRAGFDAYWSRLGALFERAPPAVRAEVDVFRGLVQVDSAELDLGRIPDVGARLSARNARRVEPQHARGAAGGPGANRLGHQARPRRRSEATVRGATQFGSAFLFVEGTLQ